MSIQSKHRYYFCVLEIEEVSEDSDFRVIGDHRFEFSQRIWEQFSDLASGQCVFFDTIKRGFLEIKPVFEFYCRNGFADPDPGDEVIPIEGVPANIHIGIVNDLPKRLYVSQSIVERLIGKGYIGVGFIEVSDNLDSIRPTYSFLRRLNELRREDDLLDAIGRYCESTGNELIRFTLEEPAYKFRGKKCRGAWYLTSSGAELALKTKAGYFFLDENESLIGELPLT